MYKLFSKGLFHTIIFTYLFLLSLTTTTPEETKNILMFTFPGDKSHCFIFLTLLQYTINKLKEERQNMKYVFPILVHNYDKSSWSKINVSSDNYKIYGFGSVDKYDEAFLAAMAYAKEDPVFGYNKFNEAMIFINDWFLKSDVFEQLKQMPKFNLIITDVLNMLAPFLKRELEINKIIYVNPTCIYTMSMPNLEYNAAFSPMIGTTFPGEMSFFERFLNFATKKGTELMYGTFVSKQNQIFLNKGYEKIDPFQPNSLFLPVCKWNPFSNNPTSKFCFCRCIFTSSFRTNFR